MSVRKDEIILPKDVFCDFCGATSEKVGKLVRSPFGVHICYDCAIEATKLIKDSVDKELEDVAQAE